MNDSVRIREASPTEKKEIIRQQREMFQDIGIENSSTLDATHVTSNQFIQDSLVDGSYSEWFAEAHKHRVIGGVEVLSHRISPLFAASASRSVCLIAFIELASNLPVINLLHLQWVSKTMASACP